MKWFPKVVWLANDGHETGEAGCGWLPARSFSRGEETHADASSEKAQGETKKRALTRGQHF